MQIESRSFQSTHDTDALHKLIADCWQAYGPRVTFHVGDLHWRLRPQPNRLPERDIRLWYAQEELLAFAWFEPPDSGDLQCHPQAERTLLEPELLAWLEQQARIHGAHSLTVGAFQSDYRRRELLKSRGYSQQPDFLCHMMRPLNIPVEPFSLPHGYSINCAATADLESLASTVAIAFGSDPKPTSAYTALRTSCCYRNDLDFVVKSEGGNVVAFCLAWLDEQNQVGLLEPVGCHPEHQRRGLAAAAVSSALQELRQAGALAVVVYPYGDDEVACRLYTKCGFRPVANDYDWQVVF